MEVMHAMWSRWWWRGGGLLFPPLPLPCATYASARTRMAGRKHQEVIDGWVNWAASSSTARRYHWIFSLGTYTFILGHGMTGTLISSVPGVVCPVPGVACRGLVGEFGGRIRE
ncbi:hypothetical protein B0T18DRAFT_385285 [Schizothecium vesticola]|uniref:Uncharacterized protein n=1 Tax=Schizothecium vesticola TaxID=314040 RepID=A0AA40F8H4_9PEZI|nr:hypothetical protein B0T18DRAFT_385285 [Schizothecium vesticola]